MNEENKTSNEAVEETQKKEEAVTASSTKKEKKGGKNAVVGFIILLILLVGAYLVLGNRGMLEEGGVNGGEESADASTVVATVNGATISRGELNEKIQQVQQSLPEGSPDPTEDAAFELQLLDDLINLKLLTTTAEERNYTVSDDEVAAEKTALIEQFGGEEALQTQLDALGITMEELEKNMRDELRIRQLLEDETDIESVTVTEAEIQAAYDSAVGDSEDAPPLDTVRDLVRAELENQKSAEIVQAYIEELRADADIEKTL